MSGFGAWIETIERATRTALGLLLLGMVALNVVAAGGRYLFGEGIKGSDEILVFSMVWLVFLGGALVAREGRHLNFGLLRGKLSGRAGYALDALIEIVTVVVLLFVARQSLDAVDRLWSLGQQSMAAGIPTAVPHTAILVGFVLTALAALISAGRSIAIVVGYDWPRREPG